MEKNLHSRLVGTAIELRKHCYENMNVFGHLKQTAERRLGVIAGVLLSFFVVSLSSCSQQAKFGPDSKTQGTDLGMNKSLGESSCKVPESQLNPPSSDSAAVDCLNQGKYPNHVKSNRDFPSIACSSAAKATSYDCTGEGLIAAAGSLGITDSALEQAVANGAKAIACGETSDNQKSVVAVLWIPPKDCKSTGSFVTACYSEKFRMDQFSSKLDLYKNCIQ